MKRQNTDIRQEQIKQAVLDIIYTDGLKNLSTRNLAKRIGMSEGAIFRHFSTKQDIILSIINDVQIDFIGQLRTIAYSPTEPIERLRLLMCATINYLTTNKGITILMFSEASHNNDAALKLQLQLIFTSQKQLVSKIVTDGMEAGIWNKTISVEYLAKLYMGIPVSLNIELILGAAYFRPEDFCSRMMELFVKILQI